MQTREIPQNEWSEYLDQFSRAHAGQPVRMETRQPGAEGEIAADRCPLLSIRPEQCDVTDRLLSLSIVTDQQGDARCVTVPEPMRVWVAETDTTEAALEIEGRDGSITLLHMLMQRPTV